MKPARKIIVAICLLGIFFVAGYVGWYLYDTSRDLYALSREMSRDMSPATFVRWLDAEPEVYANVDSIDESDLLWFAYAYDENKFANAIPNATRLPRTADANGYVPTFKLGDDIFVITWKWVNASAGLAIAGSSNFKTRLESLDHCFRVRHLFDNVYEWHLDLDAPNPD